jgi:phage major head subunit gpT-like protein
MPSPTNNDTLPRQLRLEATASLDVVAAGEGGNTLPRFRMVAYTGTPMRVAGWRHPVVIDLAGLSIPSQSRPIRFGHDPLAGVGHTDSIRIEEGQLLATGVISRDTPVAREVVASARNGFPWQASIGASVEEFEFIKENQQVMVNGRTFGGPLNIVRKSTLGEISFVDLGADGNTSATVAASQSPHQGVIMSDINTSHDTEQSPATQAIIRAKAERQRIDTIRALVEEAASNRYADIDALEKIAAQAESEGWDAQRTELAILRVTRPRAPIARDQRDRPSQQVLEAALCMAAGISDETLARDRDYGEQVVSAAWQHRRRGLRGILALALEAGGIRVPHGGREFYETLVTHQRIEAAGFSTVNLPGILGAVANKMLLDAFESAPGTYEQIAAQEDFSNFHAHQIYRLDATGAFAKVADGGEISHGTLEQTEYSNKLDTYGMMLTLTRQQIINDELSAFSSLVGQLGRRAKTAIERALYAVVMEATDVFYTATRGNRLTNAALSITSLGSARAALAKMQDANGDPLATAGRYLLVPTELEPLALQIYTSTTLNETTTTDKPRPVSNPYVNRYEPVSSPYLSTGSGGGQSPTTWYLLADPDVLPAFQVAYLDGRRQPVVETADAEFNTLGMSMRAYWDFGVARIDHRGAVKATA